MQFSNLERKTFNQNCRLIAGIDEAGRGSWAGPVTAAVVLLDGKSLFNSAKWGIRDSKQLSPKQRQELFREINENPLIEWKVSFVWPRVIDRINIWQATQLVWRRCLGKVRQPDFLFLDGKVGLPYFKVPQKAIVKGDEKILVLALASIIAKVSRDKLMEYLDKKYPEYGFSRHKGYGTEFHLERLKKYGPCLIHRKSFKPVFDNLGFKEKVYYLVSQIPKGEVRNYQEIAYLAGSPRAYRAVGNVLNKNRDPQVPCHRVIKSNGQIGGYVWGRRKKEQLLIKEGVL